ncbi:hypothetical protein GS597_19930 [Synechococcales cyanobacterium C]|uniref:Uncharacterized protein n=1 Tax=Petrachloros mirabilis ULC683 TaxID=2781853 RepID=A0A8K2AA26_9CYAN|nr:hypothetical protein [Petrachloros mirabilis]NCJ08735.1 hypothetical protein [Petrachloros mirabilis ULC683]
MSEAAIANPYSSSSEKSPSTSSQNLSVSTDNNSNASSSAQGNLNQSGSLINTQVNNYSLGRSIVGRGIADCTSSGLAISAYGSGYGPFQSGSIGGTVTYTHSFGMNTCKAYAKTQLSLAKLETCLLLISNYSQMTKAGLEVDYQELQDIANIECPTVSFKPNISAHAVESSPVVLPPTNTGGADLSPPEPVQGLW